jgi:hypothetical protein
MRHLKMEQMKLDMPNDYLWTLIPQKRRQECLELLKLLLTAVTGAEKMEGGDEDE